MKLDGKTVRLLRTTKGLDQRALSKATGISQTMICSIENGKVTISPKNQQRLIRFFNLSEADILAARNIVHMLKRFE